MEERAEPGAEDPIPDRYVSGHPVSGGNLLLISFRDNRSRGDDADRGDRDLLKGEKMFQNIYPVFEPKRLLKKEMLENLRDFPRSLFGLQYQNYSDGILYGCDITGTETGMILLPGILCY